MCMKVENFLEKNRTPVCEYLLENLAISFF